MKFYRIKQISENKFIPQVRNGFFSIIWEGIDEQDNLCWYSNSHQECYCSVSTLDEAKQRILNYKKRIEELSKYPKYIYLIK